VRRQVLALVTAAAVTVPLALSATAASKKAPTFRDYPKPPVTGKQVADRAISFSEEFALRVTGSPIQLLATDDLVAELESLGLAVEVETYNGVLQAITATKKGTSKPDELVVMGGHFDVLPQSIEGVYDNGTGTAMVLALARSFAKVKTQRTMVFSLYNGEEEGALASAEQAAAYKAAGKKVKAYLGFDMVGIGWPVGGPTTNDHCLCMWRGARDLAFDQLLAKVNFDYLKFPNAKQKVSVEGRNVRNSDEASWADAGYRTLRWAGLRTAAAYPEYHLPQDNEATIDEVAGGRKFFEMGLRNTLLSAYYTAAAIDAGA
jgi:hypothetical protein